MAFTGDMQIVLLLGACFGALAAVVGLIWAFFTKHPATRRSAGFLAKTGLLSAFAFLAQYFQTFWFVRASDAKPIFPAVAYLSIPVFYCAAYAAFDFLLVEARSLKYGIKWLTFSSVVYAVCYASGNTEEQRIFLSVCGCFAYLYALYVPLVNLGRRDTFGMLALVPIVLLWFTFPLNYVFGHAWLASIPLFEEHIWLVINHAAVLIFVGLTTVFIVQDAEYFGQNTANVDGLSARNINALPLVLTDRPGTRVGQDVCAQYSAGYAGQQL